MTRDEIIALTSCLPVREGERDCHLRALVRYAKVPPQVAFSGPLDIADLERLLSHKETWNEHPEEIFEDFYGDTPEEIAAGVQRYWEALEKAIPMAKAGWKVYNYDRFVAVLVRPEEVDV
jgi:hypothetical protein